MPTCSILLIVTLLLANFGASGEGIRLSPKPVLVASEWSISPETQREWGANAEQFCLKTETAQVVVLKDAKRSGFREDRPVPAHTTSPISQRGPPSRYYPSKTLVLAASFFTGVAEVKSLSLAKSGRHLLRRTTDVGPAGLNDELARQVIKRIRLARSEPHSSLVARHDSV